MIKNIFDEAIVLEDERALLRPLHENDYDNLLTFSLNEPGIWKYGMITAAGEENLRNYLRAAIENREQKKEYPFIVYDKKVNAFAGSTRFHDIAQPYLTAMIGYTWYGKNFQRSGLNRHCKLLLLSFAFEEWGLERVEFRAHTANEKSIAAMKAIGCVEEGILRNHLPVVDGTRRDTIVLSILKNEWFGSVKKILKDKTR